jgi:TolB-like protein
MEYVEGVTLAEMARARELDLDVVLDIFGQIADALAEAERLGIVHRDLKPANVMIASSGRVKVLDFGVAERRRPPAPSPDDPTHTSDGAGFSSGFAGTIGYAAPEQVAGRPVDTRADLFSFGVMLYELVCGARPFRGDSGAQVLEAMLTREMPPFPDPHRDPRLPALERLVRRLVARDRDDRPATAVDLRATLESIRTAVRPPSEPHADAVPVVAVAGFANISGNPEDEWLGAGIAETLAMDAAQIQSVSVLPRERVRDTLRTLRQQTGEPDERLYLRAARALGARWAVSGGFQRSLDAVRVTASLTDVASGDLAGTARVDGRVDAIFELQDRLVHELAGALRAAITPAAGPPETEVASAYEAFSRGLLNRQAESFEALDRAVAIDPADAASLGTMGRALFICHARFADAAAWFERALERNPSAGWYSLQLAHCAALLREFARGERAAARAVALQETFLSGRQGLFIAGGYMRAGHLAALQDRHAEAAAFFERERDFLVRTEHPLRARIMVELNARLGASYQRLGDPGRANVLFDAALEHFDRRVRLGADDPFTRYYAAAVYALRGEPEPALAFLEHSLSRQRAFTAARAAIEPEFESLRGDPRFQRLLQGTR